MKAISTLSPGACMTRAVRRLAQLHEARDAGRLTREEYAAYAWHTMREFGLGIGRATQAMDLVCRQCTVEAAESP